MKFEEDLESKFQCSTISDIALCFVIDAVNDDNNALALFMLLI